MMDHTAETNEEPSATEELAKHELIGDEPDVDIDPQEVLEKLVIQNAVDERGLRELISEEPAAKIAPCKHIHALAATELA